jgi:hypothetical protein
MFAYDKPIHLQSCHNCLWWNMNNGKIHNSILNQSSQKTNQINENVNEIEESILNNNNKRFIHLQWSIEIFPLECKWFNSFLFNQYRQQQQRKNSREGIHSIFVVLMCIHLWNLIDPYRIEIWFYKSMGRDTYSQTHTLRELTWNELILFCYSLWIITAGKLNRGENNGKKL